MPKKIRNINARISDEIWLALQDYALASDVSVGHVVRRAVQEYVWAHPLKKETVTKEE